MSYGPGWGAIDTVWQRLYPDREPRLFRAERPHAACKQVAAWPADESWHLVGYGLTELFSKISPNPQQDGWGYELTLRVPRDPATRPVALDLARSLRDRAVFRNDELLPGCVFASCPRDVERYG